MARMILASWILASNRRVAREMISPTLSEMWDKWETAALVLLSLLLQVILMFLGDWRKSTNNAVIRSIVWSAYMAADSVAMYALGVISTNLWYALKIDGSLSASMELSTFWAPFLLLHLGGPDTITAYALEDNELWLRHLLYLLVQTGSAIYIFLRARTGSRLSIVSAMMLVAGFIKYAERTLCLWLASYNRRRDLAQFVSSDDEEFENKSDEALLATKMFVNTEHMFADTIIVVKKSSRMVVQNKSSSVVARLVAMELELMYENLYTKAKVTHSLLGLALRIVSFFLILITLYCFSLHMSNYSTPELSVTLLLFVVAIILDVYAALVFLTSWRTISWLVENELDAFSQAMKSLSLLKNHGWSNSMGQYTLLSRFLGENHTRPHRYVMMALYVLFLYLWKKIPGKAVDTLLPKSGDRYFLLPDDLQRCAYECPVKDYVKDGIHRYLKQAEGKYEDREHSIFNSRGRVPLEDWKNDPIEHGAGKCVDPTRLNFDAEFGEMIILWHIVTEVCYYLDHRSLTGKKENPIYLNWKISKCISRYLMYLYVVSSDMLPPRGALSEKRFNDEYDFIWPKSMWLQENQGGTSNPEEERNRPAAHREPEKRKRTRARVQACSNFWDKIRRHRKPSIRTIANAVELMEALMNDDDPRVKESKLERNWKLLSEVWIELVVCAANQCRGKQHAQHLKEGGELLTHVWVLIGHFGLTEHSLE